jgi:hypothetical protein
MTNDINWSRYHKFMPKDGLCGPTTLWMVLHACEIRIPLWLISFYVYKKWWGTPPQLFIAYLSKYFGLVNYKLNATITDISKHLEAGHICIINFWAGKNDENEGEGHYAIASRYKNKVLEIIDSSKEIDWKYGMTAKELRKVWYDTLTLDNKLWHEGLLIWFDPKTKK